MPLSYLYQLQNADYQSLQAANARVAVVDADDSRLTTQQLHALQAEGGTLFSYLSVGEAEDYRAYWEAGDWDENPPPFLLEENPDWAGNYSVKFWDPAWQALMIDAVERLAERGYNGVYLDIIDAFLRDEVVEAYGDGNGPGQSGNIRTDMENFVIALSQAGKAVNPNFKIIPQNAVELLALPHHDDRPNTRYLDAIDGVGKEDTFYNGNRAPNWTEGDVALLRHAVDHGKFVLAIDYPTDPAKQADFVERALAEGYIPFVGNRALNGLGPALNQTIPDRVDPSAFDGMPSLWRVGGGGRQTFDGGLGHDWLEGRGGRDVLDGAAGDDVLRGDRGNDVLSGDADADTLTGGAGADALAGEGGDDSLAGGVGRDRLSGGAGRDVLLGGADADRFIYADRSESLTGDADLILDFTRGADRLDVSGAGFSRLAAGEQTTAADELAVRQEDERTIVFNSQSDFEIVISGRLSLTADDFIFG